MESFEIAERVGQGLRQLRTAKGLSQEAFADSIRMHRAYYSAIERGEKNLTLSTLARVAAGLGITMASLLRSCDL